MAAEHETQRIARLTPLADVLARIDALVKPVAPRRVATETAAGRVLAEDVVAAGGLPTAARALRDGFAVSAEAIADANSYAPVPLASPPARLDVGDLLPPGADAVAPHDAVVERGGRWEVFAAVASGEGVLAVNADMDAGVRLRSAGQRLRHADIAVLAAAGIGHVTVRAPLIRIMKGRATVDAVLDAARTLVARAIAPEGDVLDESSDLAVFGKPHLDAVIWIGGTGSGRRDVWVHAVASTGRLEVHGIGLTPGETSALGFFDEQPVLLIPGRMDAALAAWLVIGRRMLARLSGSTDEPPAIMAVLARKVASPLGLAEVVPVRCRDGKAEPIASGYWPLQAIAQADGWILVPADSEGYPAGAQVMVRAWP
jgi:molybdopterin molybdotransferase